MACLYETTEKTLYEFASKLATEHHAQNAIERRVDNNEEVAHVERIDVGRLELNANVLEHEQTKNARGQLTNEENNNEADDHDGHVVA